MTQVPGQTAVVITNSLLQNRLKLITQTIPRFWEQRLYTHFTNHGPEHSERVLNLKVAQLAQGLPLENRLTEDEIFIISAAAWLYEIGMQSPNLQPLLDFAYEPGVPLTTDQLLQIREHKHLLTRQLIADSIRPNYTGPRISLGLNNEADDYTRAIAEVCRWCSPEPLEEVDKFFPVNGIEIRLRLLVALLRLADQLDIYGARVNREQLLAFHLPPQVEARWWAYHYTQILPINKGKIRFYYSLPIGHRQYLGHIRALIEPTFDYENNPLIRYLDEEHDLSLSVQQQPQVRLDQQEGFLQEMPWQMVAFLRANVKPIESRSENVELVGYTEAKPQERRPLLVLDYENLLLQLGLDGYFPTLDELRKLIIAITGKANATLGDLADLWALGPWERPDMQAVKDELAQLTFQMKIISDDQKSADLLQAEFAPLLQRSNAPSKTLLVAPREELSPAVKQFKDRDVPVTAWLTDFTELSIFRVITRQPQALSEVIPLPTTERVETEELQERQELCILRLDDALWKEPDGSLEITEIMPMFNRLSELQGHGEWWKLWLLKQGILLSEETQQGYRVKLNDTHQAVKALREKRRLVIKAMQHLGSTHQEILQDMLLQTLARTPQFRDQPERTARLCQFLWRSGLLDSTTGHEGPVWQLNDEHWAVLAENSDLYLPLLVIGVDHFLLREGHPFIHEHILAGKLLKYVDYSTTRSLYPMACEKGMLLRRVSQQTFREGDKHMVEVRLADDNQEVRKALRHRNLLLYSLYNHGSSKGLTSDELWSFLRQHMQRCFTLSPQAFKHWLEVFQNADLVRSKPREGQTDEPERLLLNLANPLVPQLLARPHLLNLIQRMRVIRRQRPSIPVEEIIQDFTYVIRRLKHGPDTQLAQFAIQYARNERIVLGDKQIIEGKSVGCVKLRRDHQFLDDLDNRDVETCSALAQVVADMARIFPQGRVPEHKLLLEMEQDGRYGITHEEYHYWINQAVYKNKFLGEDRGQGYMSEPHFWAKAKPALAEVK